MSSALFVSYLVIWLAFPGVVGAAILVGSLFTVRIDANETDRAFVRRVDAGDYAGALALAAACLVLLAASPARAETATAYGTELACYGDEAAVIAYDYALAECYVEDETVDGLYVASEFRVYGVCDAPAVDGFQLGCRPSQDEVCTVTTYSEDLQRCYEGGDVVDPGIVTCEAFRLSLVARGCGPMLDGYHYVRGAK